MPKARECPACGAIFNPKFGGMAWGTQVICKNCYLKKSLYFQTQKTPEQENLQP